MLWVDKGKALEWIGRQLPNAGYATNSNESLSDATKVVESFENPRTETEKTELADVATETAETLGEGVRIVTDVSEIEGRNESETRQMRGAKGWYDGKTGEVVLVRDGLHAYRCTQRQSARAGLPLA